MNTVWRNIVVNLAGQVLLLVLGLVAVRFVFRQLGAESVGIIYFAQSISVILTSLLDLGISSSVLREAAIHYAARRRYVEMLLRTAATFYWVAYFALLAG